MVSIDVVDGSTEIGGNKIFIEHKETKIILQCLEMTGSGTILDLTTACEAFTFYENSNGNLSRVNKSKDRYVHTRDFHIMEPEKKIRIGSLKIEMIPVEHPIRDLDRVKSIFEAAKTNGRDFVVTLKLAYLIEALGGLSEFSIDDVKILVPKKSWDLIGKTGIDRSLINADYSIWERDFLYRPNSITCEYLKNDPGKYVVSMNLWEINQLIDIRPQDAVWIKSSCEPFCEDMDLDEERKHNWLKRFGIQSFLAHASGHASADEIKKMVEMIDPQYLIPIHTQHPELF